MILERHRAIVIGAGIAGLLAARALSRHFKQVTVIEKDVLPAAPTARAGVPQGKHTHVLLPGGLGALDRLFPGRTVELLQHGAQPFDYGQSQFYFLGNWMPRIQTGLNTLAQTRPFIEHHIRRWVSELSNVEIVHGASVLALLWDPSRSRVTGLAMHRAGAYEELRVALVIDATGGNTRLPRWLAENGYPPVPETKVGIDLGYATGRFRVPDRIRPTHPMLYIVGTPPHSARVGVRVLVEGGVVCGGMGGYHGDHPPGDLKGFLEFARSLSQPDIFDVLSQSELLSPIARYRIPFSNRRHYARMPRFPHGVLPLGDSVCNFDPVFGQGMAVTALEAEALADSLDLHRASEDAVRREYFRRIDAVIDVAWDMCSSENFKYPQITGRRPLMYKIARRYKDRMTTCQDPSVIRDLYRVSALTAPPKILLRPGVVARTLGLRIGARATLPSNEA
jgi:2-polyprenyl-6-methoxyphenol hydroxylase-like FAD-dependent oxidoreductase